MVICGREEPDVCENSSAEDNYIKKASELMSFYVIMYQKKGPPSIERREWQCSTKEKRKKNNFDYQCCLSDIKQHCLFISEIPI